MVRRALMLVLAMLAFPVLAQDWPTRPVHLVVPFPPGGNVDVTAREIAVGLSAQLGQPVVVENHAGAGGLIGTDYVAKSSPDGNTLLIVSTSPLLFAPTLFKRPLYHWRKNFAPITPVAFTPLVIHVNASLPVKNISELLALSKARPNGLVMSSAALGSTNHLVAEIIRKKTGVRWLIVHYNGNAPAVQALVAGQADIGIDQISVVLSQIVAGRTRALAVIGPQRIPRLPDVPTLGEQGVEGVSGRTFVGLLAPAGTPAPVLARLSAAMRVVLADSGLQERMHAVGSDSRWMTPAEFANLLEAEEASWMPTLKTIAASKE